MSDEKSGVDLIGGEGEAPYDAALQLLLSPAVLLPGFRPM